MQCSPLTVIVLTLERKQNYCGVIVVQRGNYGRHNTKCCVKFYPIIAMSPAENVLGKFPILYGYFWEPTRFTFYSIKFIVSGIVVHFVSDMFINGSP